MLTDRKLLQESIASLPVLHEYKADIMFEVSSAATIFSVSVSVTAPLTVWRLWTKFIGSFQHVLAQQLCVGRLGGKLLIQLVIDELLYSSTWITGDKEIILKLYTPGEKRGCACLGESFRGLNHIKMAKMTRTFGIFGEIKLM